MMRDSAQSHPSTDAQERSHETPFSGGGRFPTIAVRPDILFWAFRYALGRSTYAVEDVASALCENAEHFSPAAREVIVREIRAAPDLGHDCDRRAWMLVVSTFARTSCGEAVASGQTPGGSK